MIRINLLGQREVHRTTETNWLRNGFFIASGLIFALFLAFYWTLGDQIKRLSQEKETLERQAASFSHLQKEIKELREKKELAQKRLDTLNRLEAERHGPVQLLEQLTAALPTNRLWLTALKETDSEIRIEGMSLSNQVLADFMKKLDGLPFVSRIDLVQSSQVAYKDLKIKQFILTAPIKGREAPVPPQEKK